MKWYNCLSISINKLEAPIRNNLGFTHSKPSSSATKIKNSKTDFVLLDRYYHASIAYQGFGRGISRSLIDNLINAINAPKPDLTFLLDISPEEGFARKQNHQMDRIESSGLTFFNDVRKGYIQLADENDFFYKIVVSDK